MIEITDNNKKKGVLITKQKIYKYYFEITK